MACYGTLALLVFVRVMAQRSWGLFGKDVIALLPGIVVCGLVIHWMVSIAGRDFITQENILSWPTSFFMRNYGKVWLAQNGFTVSPLAFRGALFRAIPIVGIGLAAYCTPRWKKMQVLLLLLAALYIARQNYFLQPFLQAVELTLSAVFFPQDMVLYIILAAFVSWLYFWRSTDAPAIRNPTICLLLTFSSLLAFRILMKMAPDGYAIYYNGPVVLSFLLLLCLPIPRLTRSRSRIFVGELMICIACLTVVALHARASEMGAKNFVNLTTKRGTIRVSKNMAESYGAAIQFMKEKASLGESVLSVPEDTSLYFLAETHCPTRVYAFDPGILAPGKMTDETIQQIERQPVRYLLWSNRTYPEYGAPIFGVSSDRPLGDYLKLHYRPIGPLLPPSPGSHSEWTAVVWERRPELN